MSTEDKALETARRMVQGKVCECGHDVFEHASITAYVGREEVFAHGGCYQCDDCHEFRPVAFTVTRQEDK